MGAAGSHLGMAEGEAKRGEATMAAGGRSSGGGRIKGVPDSYDTGTASMGRGTSGQSQIASDPWEFASAVSSAQQGEPHPARGRLSQGESQGSRLTVSPSMKIPTESPVPTQGGGMPVPSTSSRTGSFGAGQSEASRG